jgi:transposase
MVYETELNANLADQSTQRLSRAVIGDILRERITKYIVDQKHSAKEAGEAFGVKPNTASRIASIYRVEGRTSAKRRGGVQTQKMTESMKLQVREWVDQDCTLPLKLVAQKASKVFNTTIGRKTVQRCLSAFHYTLKCTSIVPERRNCPSTLQKHMDFVSEIVGLDPNILVFIDEVGFNYTMRVGHGQPLSGERANVRVPTI